MPAANPIPPSYSIAQDSPGASWRNGCRRCFLFSILVLYNAAAMGAYLDISFRADSIEHENISMRQVRGQLDVDGQFSLDAEQITITGLDREIDDVSLLGAVEQFDRSEGDIRLRTTVQAGAYEAAVDLFGKPGEFSAGIRLARQDLLDLRDLDGVPGELDWLSRGWLDAEMSVRQSAGKPMEVSVHLLAGGVGFDSPEGRFAAEGLTLDVVASLSESDWLAPRIEGHIQNGELLIDDFYRDFSDGAIEFSSHARWRDERLELQTFSLTDQQSLTVAGRAVINAGSAPELSEIEISRLELDFPLAYTRYVEAVLAPYTLDGLTLTGRVTWSGEWASGQFHSGELESTDLSIVDTRRNRFAITGLDVLMRPGDHTFDSRLGWRGLLLGRINLGRGELALDSEPGKFAIVKPLVLDVMGGTLSLHELNVLLPGGSGAEADDPDIRIQADLEEVDMEKLTAAFGWPSFSGKISGRIPGVSIVDGVLDVEGKILVSVFDGQISLEDLRIERPFGVLPSLAANVEIESLDLESVTRTFSFGQIAGRVDGYVRDLRMLDWKPVAFDAWLGTPEGQRGSEDISRKAVNRLTTLGGGSATTALTSPLLRLFNNFSYKRLGLGCRMQNNICEIRGVSEDDVSVLIMEGAGVPKITIRAFNRSVDWPVLLAHLVAASEGEGVRVGD